MITYNILKLTSKIKFPYNMKVMDWKHLKIFQYINMSLTTLNPKCIVPIHIDQ